MMGWSEKTFHPAAGRRPAADPYNIDKGVQAVMGCPTPLLGFYISITYEVCPYTRHALAAIGEECPAEDGAGGNSAPSAITYT